MLIYNGMKLILTFAIFTTQKKEIITSTKYETDKKFVILSFWNFLVSDSFNFKKKSINLSCVNIKIKNNYILP